MIVNLILYVVAIWVAYAIVVWSDKLIDLAHWLQKRIKS